MIPYGKHSLDERDIEAVDEVLRSDFITQGPVVDDFERKLEETFEVEHAIVVNNGTTALELAYKALGLSNGDGVLTTPNTFVATANAAVMNGANPHFIDIDPATFNLDISKVRKFLDKNQNNSDIIGLTPVHFAGLPCPMEELRQIADKHDLFILEDACHAPGAEWKDSQGNWNKIGSSNYSDASVMSFHPVKHFTTGEGGAILTNNNDTAEKLTSLRSHGIVKDSSRLNRNDGPWYYEMQSLGRNGRITDFQCALGIKQLDRLEQKLEERRQQAKRYRDAFEPYSHIQVQEIPDGRRHAYHLFVVRVPDRDELFEHLQEHGISPQVHYIPVPHQPYYQNQFNLQRDDCPQASEYYDEAITLPLYPDLSPEDQDHVIQTILDFFSTRNQ